MTPFKTSSQNFKAKIRASTPAVKSYPRFAYRIIRCVIESWEEPQAEQYENAYEEFIQELSAPARALQRQRRAQIVRITTKIDRMKELAPDLFERALSHTGIEQNQITTWRKNDAK